MTADTAPLLAGPQDRVLAWRQGRPVQVREFLARAQALARRLPEGQPVNLCTDRLNFTLALAAALLRGRGSWMPPNALVDTLRALPQHGPLLALADGPVPQDVPGLTVLDMSQAFDGAWADAQADGEPASGAAAGAKAEAGVPAVSADLAAVSLFTSGSTGAPQPHAKRWGDLHLNIAGEAERLAELMDWPDIRGLNLVATVPPQHSYGIESSVLIALLAGAAFDAGRAFYPADIAAALQRLPHPRGLITTPFHLKALLLSGVALPRVDLVLSATAPLSPQLAEQAESAMGARVLEIYGCTEAGQVAARRTTAGDQWKTMGALRLSAHPRPAGQASDGPDEVFSVQGGHVREATPLADVLVLQDERHFRLLGRANDLIHVAGKRSSLAHLNYHLNRIPGVEDGAFFLPASVEGEAVMRTVAFVVAPGLSARAVIAALRERIEPAFVPRRVIAVPVLPRNDTGKLTAAALQALAREHLGDAAGEGSSPPADDDAPTEAPR